MPRQAVIEFPGAAPGTLPISATEVIFCSEAALTAK